MGHFGGEGTNDDKLFSYTLFFIIILYLYLLFKLTDKLPVSFYSLLFIFVSSGILIGFILFLFLGLIIEKFKNKFIFIISVIFILIPIFWGIEIFIHLPEYKNTIYGNWQVSINGGTGYNNINYMNDSYVIYESGDKTFTKKITDDMVFHNLDNKKGNKNNKKSSTTTGNKESSQKCEYFGCECKCK